LLKDGRLVQLGTAEELYNRPASLFAAGFFSEINVFEGKVASGAVDTPLGRFEASGLAEGAEASVAFRLSAFEVSPTHGEIPARIVSRRFLGVVELLELAVPG